MRRDLSVVALVAALAACGSKGGESEESTSAESTSGALTEPSATEPTSGGTDPTGPAVDDSCEMLFASRENLDMAAGVLVAYRFGNQIEGSELRIFVDGSIYHSERTCCPPSDDPVAEQALATVDVQALTTKAEAVIAAEVSEENLGPMAEGQQTGLMCVLVNGKVGTVRAFEAGDEVIKRVSAAPEAADIVTVVHGYTKLDMPE